MESLNGDQAMAMNISRVKYVTANGFATIPTIVPALPPQVHLALTVVFTALYSILFIIVYVQLWMILYYRHRRFSYQTVFLFTCLLWAALRTTLFSFYFNNCILANDLDLFPYWLLYCFPICLQFSMLCLLVLYFGQVVFKAMNRFEPRCYKIALWVTLGATVAIFLGTNVTCAVIIKQHEQRSNSPPEAAVLVRVIVNDSLFLACGVALFVFLFKLRRLSSAVMALEAKGTPLTQAIVCSVIIVVLFISRVLYNFVVTAVPKLLSFGYGWINVSDQADYANLTKGTAYASFGIVLFVWEFLPTFIFVVLFRVQRPKNSSHLNALKTPPYDHPRAYFFDNPRRYDSEEDLSRSHGSRSSGIDAVASSFGTPGSPRGLLGSSPPGLYTPTQSVNINTHQAGSFYDGT